VLFDKTGTLTAGRPHLAAVEAVDGDIDGILRLAAALEQASPHVLAAAVVQAARKRDLVLPIPTAVVETPGAGVAGIVDGRTVAVGSAAFVADGGELPIWARELRRRAVMEGATNVYVRVDGVVAGALILDDPIRAETPRAVRSLRRAGFSRILMVTGDHHAVAELVGAAIGLDGVLADRAPVDKVEAVQAERDLARGPVVMVGDGINDAPALAVADVGVAMGARITCEEQDRQPQQAQGQAVRPDGREVQGRHRVVILRTGELQERPSRPGQAHRQVDRGDRHVALRCLAELPD